MLAGAGIATAIPGAGGALTKAIRPGLRAGEHAVRPPIGQAIDPALRNHGFTPQQFQELMVRPVRPLTPGEIANLPPGTVIPQPLNRTESAVVDSARAAIPPLTPTTPLQKALDPQGGQLANILNNHTSNVKRFPLNGVGGSVAALDDVIALATPRDLFNGLALHYPGSGHQLDNAFVLRFTTPDVGIVPNGPLLSDLLTPGGLHPGEGFTPPLGKSTYPFTGHGFTGSPGHIIPEYELNMARMDLGAQLVKVAEDGSTQIIRVLTKEGWVTP